MTLEHQNRKELVQSPGKNVVEISRSIGTDSLNILPRLQLMLQFARRAKDLLPISSLDINLKRSQHVVWRGPRQYRLSPPIPKQLSMLRPDRLRIHPREVIVDEKWS